jgi:hypothetical protein
VPLPKEETAPVENKLADEPELELNAGKPNAGVLNGGKEFVWLTPKIELDAAAADDDDDDDADTEDGNTKALVPNNAVRLLIDAVETVAPDDCAAVPGAAVGALDIFAGTAEFDDVVHADEVLISNTGSAPGSPCSFFTASLS